MINKVILEGESGAHNLYMVGPATRSALLDDGLPAEAMLFGIGGQDKLETNGPGARAGCEGIHPYMLRERVQGQELHLMAGRIRQL